MSDILDRIETIRNLSEEYYNENIPKPIPPKNIGKFKVEYHKCFGINVDDNYLEFLNICDGLEEGGIKILSSTDKEIDGVEYGILKSNKTWYETYDGFKDYIFFASSGLDFFVFNKKSSKYELRDRYGGDIMETFESFNDMLLYILKLMLGEKNVNNS